MLTYSPFSCIRARTHPTPASPPLLLRLLLLVVVASAAAAVAQSGAQGGTVTYRSIAQARGEAPLVAALLRRLAKGESGDYTSAPLAGEPGGGAGQAFPALYYRQVRPLPPSAPPRPPNQPASYPHTPTP